MNENEQQPKRNRSYYVFRCADSDRLVIYKPPFTVIVSEGSTLVDQHMLGHAHGMMLELFASNPDEVIDRDRIFAIAWPNRAVSSNSLNQAISLIRQLLGDEHPYRAIKTVTRRGYIFDSAFIVNDLESKLILENASVLDMPESDSKKFGFNKEQNIYTTQAIQKLKRIFVRPQKFNYPIIAILLALSMTLCVRIYYIYFDDWEYVSATEQIGNIKILYISSRGSDIQKLESSVAVIKNRILDLSKNPSSIIFNRMNDYFNIVCLSDRTHPKFITVSSKNINALSNEEIKECVK